MRKSDAQQIKIGDRVTFHKQYRSMWGTSGTVTLVIPEEDPRHQHGKFPLFRVMIDGHGCDYHDGEGVFSFNLMTKGEVQ